MTLNGIVLGFKLEDGESLAELVKTCGFTRTKGETVARKQYANADGWTANVEVDRKDDGRVFALMTGGVESEADDSDVMSFFFRDLEKAGVW